MGLVYSAYDKELDRKVAVKVLRRRRPRRHRRARAGCCARPRRWPSSRTPTSSPIYEVGWFDDTLFLAMEFIEGRTVREWLAENPRSWREVLRRLHGGRPRAGGRARGRHRPPRPQARQHPGRQRRPRARRRLRPRPRAAAPQSLVEPRPPAHVAGVRACSTSRRPLARLAASARRPTCRRSSSTRASSTRAATCLASASACSRASTASDRSPVTTPTRSALRSASVIRGGPPRRDGPRPRAPDRAARARGRPRRPPEVHARAARRAARGDRAPRKVWLLALGSLSATSLVVGLIAAAALQRGATAEVCTGASARLAGIWDPPAREALQRAVLASGLSYAPDTWVRVAGQLDRYTAARGPPCTPRPASHITAVSSPATCSTAA